MTLYLLFETSALMETSAREWQEYQTLGSAYLPQVVYDEIKFLSDRASDPRQEQTARAFIRFQVQNNWQITPASAPHPALAPPQGQGLSKKARLELITAQSAYGFSQIHPDRLVVFVSNTQPLLLRIQAIKAANLCGMTTAQLLQWSRTKQTPPFITQRLNLLNSTGIPTHSNGHSGGLPRGATPPPQATRTPAPQPARTPQVQPTRTIPRQSAGLSTPPPRPPSASRMGRNLSRSVTQVIGTIMVLGAIAIAGGLFWRTIQPQSFNQFWNRQIQPLLNPSPSR
ncbi:PIN domain-containing protein [Geitlerinema splendidum]|nr:PIN domain-containing protein [Geitlerinema splendidum]